MTAVVAVALLGGGYLFWQAWTSTQIVPWTQDTSGVFDSDVVHLTYLGSACRSGVRADVDEQETYVVITLYETVRAFSCDDVGVTYEVDVQLDGLVGGRTLVDGSCERRGLTEPPNCPVIMAG